MSMLVELSFFLGLQISHSNKGIFISQSKSIKEMLKKFKMEDCKPVRSPIITCFKYRNNKKYIESDQTLYK